MKPQFSVGQTPITNDFFPLHSPSPQNPHGRGGVWGGEGSWGVMYPPPPAASTTLPIPRALSVGASRCWGAWAAAPSGSSIRYWGSDPHIYGGCPPHLWGHPTSIVRFPPLRLFLPSPYSHPPSPCIHPYISDSHPTSMGHDPQHNNLPPIPSSSYNPCPMAYPITSFPPVPRDASSLYGGYEAHCRAWPHGWATPSPTPASHCHPPSPPPAPGRRKRRRMMKKNP